MKEETKKKIHQIEIVAAVLLLLVSVISFFPNSGITGFVSQETKKQLLDLTIDRSKGYVLTTNSDEFTLLTFKMSGEVIGDGIVRIFIDDGQGQKLLIYSNVEEKKRGGLAITGMGQITGNAINVETGKEVEDNMVIDYMEDIDAKFDDISKDETLYEGPFIEKCADTCFISMVMNKDIGYRLLFYVEEGATLRISEIIYTVEQDDEKVINTQEVE